MIHRMIELEIQYEMSEEGRESIKWKVEALSQRKVSEGSGERISVLIKLVAPNGEGGEVRREVVNRVIEVTTVY